MRPLLPACQGTLSGDLDAPGRRPESSRDSCGWTPMIVKRGIFPLGTLGLLALNPSRVALVQPQAVKG